METLNYFKIQQIIHIQITNELIQIFKTRWNKQFNKEWNDLSGVVFKDKCEYFNKFNNSEQLKIVQGNLNRFGFILLCKLLLLSKLVNKELINENDTIITSIKIFKELNEGIISHKLQLKDYHQLNEKFKLILNELTSIERDIEISIVNNANETLANQLLEYGDKEYSNGNYDKANLLYNQALELDGLSNTTKGVLHSNSSENQYEKSIKSSKGCGIYLRHLDYNIISDAESLSITSSIERPNWPKPYFRLSKIYSRVSNYKKALQFSEVALLLMKYDPESLPSEIIEIKTIKRNSIENLNMISTCIDNNGNRNHEKESEIRLQQLGNILTTRFNDNKLTKELIDKYELLIHQTDNYNLINSKTMDYKLKCNAIFKASNYKNQNKFEEAVQLFSISIGTVNSISSVYVGFANCLTGLYKSNGIPIDEKLYLSLIIKATLIGPLYNPDSDGTLISGNNFKYWIPSYNGYISACCILGLIYRHGLLGESIDNEKSIYYLNQSVKNTNRSEFNRLGKNKGLANVALASFYLNGNIENEFTRKINREKAKQLLLEGTNWGSTLCYDILIKYFNSPNDIEQFKFLKKPINE